MNYVAPTWKELKVALAHSAKEKQFCRDAGCSPSWLWERNDDAPVPWWAHSLAQGMGLLVNRAA